jgi:hypothetical protein
MLYYGIETDIVEPFGQKLSLGLHVVKYTESLQSD